MKILLPLILILLSIGVKAQQKPACFKHVEVDNKNHTVFEQSVFFAPDWNNKPDYYLRTKLTRNDELVYIKDDDITHNDDTGLPKKRKIEAFANLKKILTISTVINH